MDIPENLFLTGLEDATPQAATLGKTMEHASRSGHVYMREGIFVA